MLCSSQLHEQFQGATDRTLMFNLHVRESYLVFRISQRSRKAVRICRLLSMRVISCPESRCDCLLLLPPTDLGITRYTE